MIGYLCDATSVGNIRDVESVVGDEVPEHALQPGMRSECVMQTKHVKGKRKYVR